MLICLKNLQTQGRCLRLGARSRATLRRHLGKIKLPHLRRERIIEFGRERAKKGAGPAILSADISYNHAIISHSAAVHGVKISTEEIDLARIALRRLGLIGRSNDRDHRPTQKELDRLISYFENFSKTKVPIARIIKLAVATGLERLVCLDSVRLKGKLDIVK